MDELEAATSPDTDGASVTFAWKLWIYTNYDCNLNCAYCVAESSPYAARRALDLPTVRRIVDEATELGFDRIYLTGGEPFLLPDIYEMLAYASARAETTVLTNATLLHGARLERLAALASANLIVQVSLDGARPEHHDPYRGAGTWARTVEGVRLLRGKGLRVRLATTETPANAAHLDELAALRESLGIPAIDHLIRPLARRGFAAEGIEVGPDCLLPEVTVTVNGVFWHPLASPSSADMQVSAQIFPLASSVEIIRSQYKQLYASRTGLPRVVT